MRPARLPRRARAPCKRRSPSLKFFYVYVCYVPYLNTRSFLPATPWLGRNHLLSVCCAVLCGWLPLRPKQSLGKRRPTRLQQGADADKSVLGSSAPVRRPPAHRGLTRFVNPHPTQRQRRHTRLTSVAEAHVVGKRCALHHRRCELLRWPCGAFLVRSAGGGRPPNQLTLPPNQQGLRRAARTRTRPCSGVLAVAGLSACTGPTQFGARERTVEHGTRTRTVLRS